MAKQPEPQQPAAPRRQRDPEILAMERIERVMYGLKEPVRGRVIRWAWERYCDRVQPVYRGGVQPDDPQIIMSSTLDPDTEARR